MGVSKVSLSIDDEALAEARRRVGGRGLSSYMSRALERQLQADRIEELLAEMDQRSGPVPEELLAEARNLWRPRAV